jgi:23S rRNA (guanosine2251-2'-O)-methyltransferase
MKREVWVLVHNIRSAHNVGSIFRTSDSIGVSHIYISGYSPTPLDRWKRPVKEIAKTALGAEMTIPWEYISDAKDVIRLAKEKGFDVVGVEQNDKSVDYKDFDPKEKTLIIMGEEVGGINKEIINECDAIIEIPMYGNKESLNVSVAFGVVMYRLFDGKWNH